MHINSEELPHMIRVDFLGEDYEDYNDIYDDITKRLNDPINIDSLRKYLDTLEKAGANYVSIDFHTGHQELELDGVLIELASQEDIDLEKQRDKEYQIRMVKNKIVEYSSTLKQFENKLKELSGE